MIHFEFVLPFHYTVGKGQSEILFLSQVSKHDPIFTVLAWPWGGSFEADKGEVGGGVRSLSVCVRGRKTVPPHSIPTHMASLRTSLLPDVPRGLSPSAFYLS